MLSSWLIILLLSLPAPASARKNIEEIPGKILDNNAFSKITHIMIIAAPTDFPTEQELLLKELEKNWQNYRCWEIMGHNQALKTITSGIVYPDGRGITRLLENLPKPQARLGILVYGVTGWTGTYQRLHKASKEMEAQMLKSRDPLIISGYWPTEGKFARSAEAQMFASDTGKPVWRASLSHSVSMLGSRPKAYETDIGREVMREFSVFDVFFSNALRRPENAEPCKSMPVHRVRDDAPTPPKRQHPKHTRKWLLQLKSKDTEERVLAARKLGDDFNRASIPYLLRALKDPAPKVRATAAHSLGRLGITDAVEPLIVLLTDKEPLVRAVSAQALGAIGDHNAKAEIEKLLKNEKDQRVRKTAQQALEEFSQGAFKPRANVNNLLEDLGADMSNE
ncbi:MAG: HEAT repeat domain-containing protein [Elusimicrobiota bacterium]